MPVTPIDLAQIGVRRKNFIGNTDKYMPFRSALPGSGGPAAVVAAVQDQLAFLDVVKDSGIYTEFYRSTAMERIARYKKFARFYEGKQWEQEYDDGERKPVFNFCQIIVDKGVDFFASKGFTVGSSNGNEDLANSVELVWDMNNKGLLTRKLCITASILGDSYLYVTLETKDAKGADLPQNKWKIRLYQIDPFFCFPVFDDINPRVMKACMIQIPVGSNGAGGAVYRTLFITPDFYQEFKDGAAGPKVPNPFGVVNVVHFPNYDDPLKVWGQSDLDTITALNEEYNIVANSIRKIIKYHAEPTTIIYGARASKLEKGAKKVWSGLPQDAKVENLQFDGQLEATYKYLTIIEDQIHKLSNIPSVLFQTDRAVSHTSAIAMKMLYQPILEKTERKQQSFTAAFKRTNALIFKAFELAKLDYLKGIDVTVNLEDDLYPVFPDPIPYDEMGQIDADQKKLNLGVTSQAALVRKYNPAGDISQITVEILADKIATQLAEQAKAVALQGGSPNAKIPFVSSLGLDPSIKTLGEQVAALVPPPTPIVAAPTSNTEQKVPTNG